jgi:LmbE family N-acetylglucosaminyl deacetylase
MQTCNADDSPYGRASVLSVRLLRSLLNRSCVEVPASELAGSAVVFSPHPDDESLGCGGTILKKKREGARIALVEMTDGSASTNVIPREELKTIRKQEVVNAAGILGVYTTYFLEFPDTKLNRHLAAATDRVLEVLEAEHPKEIFIPHHRELPRQAADHLATTDAVLTALRRYSKRVVVWEYPVWAWLHWPWVTIRQYGLPNIRSRQVFKNSVASCFGLRDLLDFRQVVDISGVLREKREAIAQHRSQMEQLVPSPDWHTVGQVSNGEFLACFFQDREFFRRSVYDGSHGAPSPGL